MWNNDYVSIYSSACSLNWNTIFINLVYFLIGLFGSLFVCFFLANQCERAFIYLCMWVCTFSGSVRLFPTPRTVAHEAPLSWGFSGLNTEVGLYSYWGIFWAKVKPISPHIKPIWSEFAFNTEPIRNGFATSLLQGIFLLGIKSISNAYLFHWQTVSLPLWRHLVSPVLNVCL